VSKIVGAPVPALLAELGRVYLVLYLAMLRNARDRVIASRVDFPIM
jgi:hypothetical protein